MHLAVRERREIVRFLDLERRGDFPRGPVGEPDVAHFAGPHDDVECGKRLFERRERILAVHDVDVDPVGAEAPQALVDRPQDVATRQAGLRHRGAAAHSDLGRDHDIVATGLQRRAARRFGLTNS